MDATHLEIKSRRSTTLQIQSIFFYAMSIGAILTLVLFTKDIPGSLGRIEQVPCAGVWPDVTIGKLAKCETRGLMRNTYLRAEPADSVSPLTIVPMTVSSKEGGVLSFHLQSAYGESFVGFQDSKGKSLIGSVGIGSGWSGTNWNLIQISIPKGENQVSMVVPKGTKHSYLTKMSFTPGPVEASAATSRKSSETSSYYLLLTLVSAIGFGFLFAIYRMPAMVRLRPIFLLLYGLTLTTLFAGEPYYTNVGVYDAGDDRSYLDWAYHIGFKLNPSIKHSPIDSWSSGSNHHTWGTGIALGAFLAPMRLIYSKNTPPNAKHYTILSFASMTYSFLAVYIFFLAFSQIFSKGISVVIALSTLSSTSLLKWTYHRNIFSHSVEAFLFSIMTFFFIKYYFTKNGRIKDLIWYGVASFCMIQTRRENILFALLPLIYEVVSLFGKKKREGMKISLFVVAGISVASTLLGMITLQLTNYLTQVNSFFSPPNTMREVHFDQILTLVPKNYFNVLFSSAGGLFAWWNFPVFIAGIALLFKKSWKPITLVALCFIFGYIFMCLIHDFPTGCEWQNRFLLKLNPFIFAGCGCVLAWTRVPWVKTILFMLLIATSILEISFFREYQPYGIPFYSDMLSDFSLTHSQPFGERPLSPYLPLIVLFGAMMSFLVVGLISRIKDIHS